MESLFAKFGAIIRIRIILISAILQGIFVPGAGRG